MQLDRQTDWLITRLSSRRVRHVGQRSTILPQPSSLSWVCSGTGSVEEAQLGQTANLGWGYGVRAQPGWSKGQSVGYMFVQFLKGRLAPCSS